MAFDQPSLKGRALRLLGQREHSRAELERKLRQHALAVISSSDGDEAVAPEGRRLDR